jgi:hypothetical protein
MMTMNDRRQGNNWKPIVAALGLLITTTAGTTTFVIHWVTTEMAARVAAVERAQQANQAMMTEILGLMKTASTTMHEFAVQQQDITQKRDALLYQICRNTTDTGRYKGTSACP